MFFVKQLFNDYFYMTRELQVYDTNANEIKRVIVNTWNNNFKL